jgi:transcription elongation GreA/GreB family factor
MSRSIPPRDSTSTGFDPAETQLPALTARGRELVGDKIAVLRSIRLPEQLVLARADPDDGRLSTDYVRLLGELWELERLLAESITVGKKKNHGVVEFGDLVTIEFSAHHGLRRRRTAEQYLLVHPSEAPLDQLRISVDSPLARALLGQRVGARVVVQAPAGRYSVRVLATEDAPDGG